MDFDYIQELIQSGYECDHLDFKATQYRNNFRDLIIDVMSMANSNYLGDKYIILGIKDKPGNDRNVIGIASEDFIDSSIYQNIIREYIEPEIKIDYYPMPIQSRQVGILRIHSSNSDKPYMLKKQYNGLREGLCMVRKGSSNVYAKRKDLEGFYLLREIFEVELMENTLAAAAMYDKIGCARTSVSIRNHTSLPVVLRYGMLTIYNRTGEELSRHQVYGFEKDIMGADFKLSVAPKEEKYGSIWVDFSSSDCLRLKLDEDGLTEERFVFELLFIDTQNREYIATIENGFVYAKGDFLWKVHKRK